MDVLQGIVADRTHVRALIAQHSAEIGRRRWSVSSRSRGIATNVARRCEQHNAGTALHFTRRRLPVALVYQERQRSRSLALKREAAIKALSRAKKESLVRLAG